MSSAQWLQCLDLLCTDVPLQQFNTWLKPLEASVSAEGVTLIAPNRFVADWVNDRFYNRLSAIVAEVYELPLVGIRCAEVSASASVARPTFKRRSRIARRASRSTERVSSSSVEMFAQPVRDEPVADPVVEPVPETFDEPGTSLPVTSMSLDVEPLQPTLDGMEDLRAAPSQEEPPITTETVIGNQLGSADIQELSHHSLLNKGFDFESFVIGKSNQLAAAAARQVAENPGAAGQYNPLFIYGGVGLGKTHLMQAVGNEIMARNPGARVLYLRSERFVADMVKALQLNAMSDFKRYYRSMDALLIDDIQFFAGKDRTQEEFFHTFNALLEGGQQIIVTSDRYPKEISGLEARLKSRFEWGLTVAVEPPELETRVAILMKKAAQQSMVLPDDAAFFIAQRIRSHVRELEGALTRVIAHARFVGKAISIPLVRDALRDLLAIQDKQVSIDNIQRVVAEFYKLKLSELLSKKRTRSIARPRQLAMALSKELTSHSYPEIGAQFGGRDHTTVLHAVKKVKELKAADAELSEDYETLLRSLTS